MIKVISDKAQRLEQLNHIRLDGPVAYDPKFQLQVTEEALNCSHEIGTLIEEAITMLKTDLNEHLEVFHK